jgi:prevent-host-death family protein
MKTRTINSTEAQNNFGQIIDAVVQDHTRFIVKRRNISQVVIMSLSDLSRLLSDASERKKMDSMIRELTPVYNLGETVDRSE